MSSARRDAGSLLAELELDVRTLIREAAEARFRSAEAERREPELQRKWLLATIGVLDALERVFLNVDSKPDRMTDQMRIWVGNFRAVGRLVERQLRDHGARRMPSGGAAFDPERQTILDTIEDPTREEGTVVEEVRPGWERDGEVLRKAEVRGVRNTD